MEIEAVCFGRLTVHPLVHVHGAVPKVLPAIEDESGKPELDAGNDDPVDGLGQENLPGCERGNSRAGHVIELEEGWVETASERASKQRV